MPGDPTIVFILGTGRCGSTLVEELCCRHPAVAFVSNLEDRAGALRTTGRFNNALYRRVPDTWTAKGRLRFAPSEGYRALDREVSPILSDPIRDLTAADATPWLTRRLRRFVESRMELQNRTVFLHKFTGWPRAGLLAAVFPEARFVHLVRDGRAVANSLVQMPWWGGRHGPRFGPLPAPYEREWQASGRSFTLLAGIEWKLLIDAHAAAERELGAERWTTLRYEDLLADPRRTLGTMLDVAGLRWTEAFDRAVGLDRLSGARRDAFRTDLGPDDLAALEASLRGHLAMFGYE